LPEQLRIVEVPCGFVRVTSLVDVENCAVPKSTLPFARIRHGVAAVTVAVTATSELNPGAADSPNAAVAATAATTPIRSRRRRLNRAVDFVFRLMSSSSCYSYWTTPIVSLGLSVVLRWRGRKAREAL
jgi:hypothetical protein